MKRLFLTTLSMTMILTLMMTTLSTTTLAIDPYSFGKPTSVEIVSIFGDEPVNINRSKDASELPPYIAPKRAMPQTDISVADDGVVGTITIDKLNLMVSVYEGVTDETMKLGAGHLSFTSVWNGNVGIAAHNRGAANFFGKLHTLSVGDTIVYTTSLGTRVYEVFYIGKINETDLSRFAFSDEHLLTLTTCVAGSSTQRWCVQARQSG